MRLFYHQISTLQPVFIGKRGKLIYRVLFNEIVGKLHHLCEIIELETIVIGINEGKLQYQPAHACFFIIRSNVKSVFRNKDIRRYPTTSIYCSSETCVVCRTCMFDAVL